MWPDECRFSGLDNIYCLTTFVYKHFLSDHYLIELNHYSAISFVCMHMLRSNKTVHSGNWSISWKFWARWRGCQWILAPRSWSSAIIFTPRHHLLLSYQTAKFHQLWPYHLTFVVILKRDTTIIRWYALWAYYLLYLYESLFFFLYFCTKFVPRLTQKPNHQ